MALYELRTYTLHVGKMAEAVKLYQEIGFPALQKGGQDKKLVGYFQRPESLHEMARTARMKVLHRLY